MNDLIDLLINTDALARCKRAPLLWKVFQRFAASCPTRGPRALAAALFLVSFARVFAETHYVDLNSTNATPPYTNWATAATNIQDAVDAAVAGDEVVVTDGTYATGGRSGSRVSLDSPLSLRSLNGPAVTSIQGYNGNRGEHLRCVYLTAGASVSGFTLTGGRVDDVGGGAAGADQRTCTLINCTITGNSANTGYVYGESAYGGGAYGCMLINCTVNGNSATAYGDVQFGIPAGAYGGGAYDCTLNNCTLTDNSVRVGGIDTHVSFLQGGGAYYCILNNCTLSGNSTGGQGGGADDCTLNNCTLTGNSANSGGGANGGTLYSCTLTGNQAVHGGGSYGGTLDNCIVYFNGYENYSSCTLSYCCTTPLPYGPGNITNAPLFVNTNGWADLHLQFNSPCINAGNNSCLTNSNFTNCFDLDGNPRIVGGTVDIGVYEYQSPTSLISYAWLQLYGQPIDGSADFTDPDRDGMNNWQEWRCGTDPTNASSALRMLAPMPTGTNMLVTWQSAAGVNYFLQRSTNLTASPAFVTLATGIEGQAGTTTFVDSNASGAGPFFYRVGVGGP
jgi:hypothetical protein